MEKSDVSPDQKNDSTLEVDQMNHHPRVIEMKRNDVLNDSEEMKITEDQGWFTDREKIEEQRIETKKQPIELLKN